MAHSGLIPGDVSELTKVLWRHVASSGGATISSDVLVPLHNKLLL